MSPFQKFVRSLTGPSKGGRQARLAQWLKCERLEDRLVMDGTPVQYIPPSHFFSVTDSAPTAGDPLTIALNYLNTHAGQFGLTPNDLTGTLVTDDYTDTDTGLTHIYLRQQVAGLEVENANLNVTVASDGRVVTAAGEYIVGLAGIVAQSGQVATLSAAQAVQSAASALGIGVVKGISVVTPASGIDSATVLSAPDVSLDNITAKLHYIPTADGGATLSWDLIIRTTDHNHWYDLSINAATGALDSLNDWADNATYNVVARPNQTPADGFTVLVDPQDPTASPYGWHDTNGVAGPEFTDTRGNNVDAHLDHNGDNIPDADQGGAPRPDGGANLDFSSYTFDPNGAPTTAQNENIAQINLFYAINTEHDIQYHYGFTEAAGNFQVDNYGRGGIGGDAVQADAQDDFDNGTTDNANFQTPPDGEAPRMQQYVFDLTSPERDSDLDNAVVFHEFGHGVSNRLTGGPSNSDALQAVQSGGMGEGWSDFYALMLTQRPTDTQNGAYGIGQYLLGEPASGVGIRRFPYSYNMTTDPLNFEAYGDSGTTSYGTDRSTEVHDTGEIWCSALWDMNWLLIDKYGYDSNLYTGWAPNTGGPASAGNKLALDLVNEAMKLQPTNPSFTDARNAILAADQILNGGKDQAEIWAAFARRGLGLNASTDGSDSTTIHTDYTVPVGITITPTTPALPEGNSGYTPFTFTVTLSAPTANTVTVKYTTVDGTATVADNDYLATSGTLTFNPGTTSETITVLVKGDLKFEPDETFSVTLSAPTNAYFTVQTASETILNDDTFIKPDVHIVAVATDAGVVAEVRALDPATDAVRWAVHPFDGFTGSVSVAVGDINNDGYQDVVVGAGPGAGPRVVVLSGIDGTQITSFYAFSASFAGGVTVATGDVNGDGYADIIVGADTRGYSHVKVFDGRTFQLIKSFYAFNSNYQYGVRVASGDVNGDGYADILVGAGAGAAPQYRVFDGRTGAILQDGMAFTSDFMGGVSIAAGDINGDGFADIIIGAGSGTSPAVQVFNGISGAQIASFYVNEDFSPTSLPSVALATGVSVAAKDLDGDGVDEILVGKGSGTNAILRSFRLAKKTVGIASPVGLTPVGSANVFPGYYGGFTVGA